MNVEQLHSISVLSRREWNTVSGTEYPFLRHEFLHALEHSECCSEQSGWIPHHFTVRDTAHLIVAVMPAYLKLNSAGEFVFDWSWAEAFHRYGYPYYPKLLTAVPFTPTVGPRVRFHPKLTEQQRIEACRLIFAAIEKHAQRDRALPSIKRRMRPSTGNSTDCGISSWHGLFPDDESQSVWQSASRNNLTLIQRLDCQYHWLNRSFSTFDDFLETMSSRKRKNIKKERNKLREAGVLLQTVPASDISEHQLEVFFLFYQATYAKRGQRPYLTMAFFKSIVASMPEQISFCFAVGKTTSDAQYLAAALFLHNEECLFGRYWGCLNEYEFLHFEVCYYHGIELCLEKNLKRFDAGTQGEHKLLRGFEPRLTSSFHWIAEPMFQSVIKDFCQRESDQIRLYVEHAYEKLPFKEEVKAEILDESVN